MTRRPPRSTLDRSSAASDVYKRQAEYIEKQKVVEDGGPIGVVGRIGWYMPTYMVTAHPELATWEGLTTCLLYTSPSPRDRTRSRMPSSAWKKKKHTTHTHMTNQIYDIIITTIISLHTQKAL